MGRVLAFGCHPDDVEFMAAGALALLAERGFETYIATMTGGQVGHPTLPAEQVRARRLAEAQAAAQVINAAYHRAGVRNLEVEYSLECRQMATRVMREVDPLIVLTLPPSDYLADHEETSKLVRNAAYIASVPGHDCGIPIAPTSRFPYPYYGDASSTVDVFGRPLPLHFGIDVTSAMSVKEEMLRRHESQAEWLAHHNGWVAYLDAIVRRTWAQGERLGGKYAECLIQHLGTGHPQDNVLGEILGDLCVDIDPPTPLEAL